MATVEQHAPETHERRRRRRARRHGDPGREPGDGRDHRAPCPTSTPPRSPRWRARGRAAQPEWEAYGFEGRARVLLRAQKWVMDNAPQIVETICSETGKTFEDAELAEIGYAGAAFGFWAKHGAEVPRRRARASRARCS